MLANILTAATYPDQIPEADQWADQHAGLHGDALAHAIGEDHLPWDPSVQALLPFPQVLEMMARDPGVDAEARRCGAVAAGRCDGRGAEDAACCGTLRLSAN